MNVKESSINNVQPNEILEYIPNITTIIDTSSSDMTNLQKELKRADVIWLVYSDHYTYERISLHWMPLFRSMGLIYPLYYVPINLIYFLNLNPI